MSPCIERTTHRSSTISAWCGNRSETSIPDLPYFLKVRLQPENARVGVDVLILHVAELGRPLLPVELVEQRLRVPRLQVRRTARHVDEDERLRLGMIGHVRRLRRERIVAWRRAPALGHHGRESERSYAAEAVGQKFAAVSGESNVFGHISSRTEKH